MAVPQTQKTAPPGQPAERPRILQSEYQSPVKSLLMIARDELMIRERKARDSNPHFPKENRVSSAARPTVSGYLPDWSVVSGSVSVARKQQFSVRCSFV
jgi:hypothetical protein